MNIHSGLDDTATINHLKDQAKIGYSGNSPRQDELQELMIMWTLMCFIQMNKC
jgi:hypothetical protein